MILSQKKIEEIAVAVIRDFQKSFFGSEADDPARFALPTPIDQFASDYLNLKVSFQKLSSDGSIYGLTAYVDTEYQIEVDGSQRSIFLKTNDVVLDKSFIEPENIRKLCGKRRFTLAHECAHQILFQLDADDRKIACHKRPEVRGNGSRVLRTQEDWNEWQANALGAAILMPQSEVDRAMWFINSRKPLTCYGWHFYDKDQVKIDTFCSVFGVSRSAEGMELTGTVRNVIDFGAFVDIGVHQDGLVHISQITDRYIKHPSEAVSLGDVVTVKVLAVDLKRKRISLTMII